MILKIVRNSLNPQSLAKFLSVNNFRRNWSVVVQRLLSPRLKSIARSTFRPQIISPLIGIALFGSSSDATTKVDAKLQVKMAQRKEILENADQLLDESRYQECHDLLFKIENSDEDPDVLWRKARVLQKLAKVAEKKQREQYIRNGFDYIEKALKLDDQNFAIHKWYAILLDCRSELDGIKKRVSEVVNVKHHMVRATELNPNDPTSWYILGELEFSLADISWYVSKLVSAIFATPPTGSFDRALECFLKAEALEPNFYCRNHLMLGKTYLHFKNNEKAKEHITIAANCKVNNYDDKITKEEAEQVLKKL